MEICVCSCFFRNDGEDKKGRASAWTEFDHVIICGTNGAARSVSNLPCSNNRGAEDGVVPPVSDLPHSRSFHRAQLFTSEGGLR